MINCREVYRLIISDQLLEQGWIRRIEIRMHLLMCRHCSRVMRHVKLVKQSARLLWTKSEPSNPQDDPLVARLLARLLNKK